MIPNTIDKVLAKTRASLSSRSSISKSERISDIADLFEISSPALRPVTLSMKAFAVSRPITSTLPSFSQNASVINVTINYGGEDCYKKFLNLTKAFNQKDTEKVLKSLVREKIYDEFSTLFWLKPEFLFKQIHNENVGSSFEQQPLEKTVKKPPKLSSLTTSNPSTVKTTNTSRPVILTIPSFSQNTNQVPVAIILRLQVEYVQNFHLRCIIISLKKNTTCSRCQRLIYLGEDDDARLNPQEEDDRVKKFFKELSNKPQDFNPSPVTNIETENSTTPDIVFVELHNKILVAERILKEKTLKVSHMEYEILDSYYPLGEALEKKLAEFKSIHPGQPKKHSAKNIYNIFKTEGLGRDEIKQIRRISLLSFGKFTDKEIKIIQEKVRANSSRPNWLENQFNDLDLNRESVPMQTD
uniref:Uncharacterized protein n=1 Tax=Rhizophagus irregularis (strain DAOM 181602 / DAOM 197198 / MUCL 43194) TaxID=747089 RepID=U9U120_RHIID